MGNSSIFHNNIVTDLVIVIFYSFIVVFDDKIRFYRTY